MSTLTTNDRGLRTGTWEIDPGHSLIELTVRHLMVSKVKGRFDRFTGTITVGGDAASSSVHATIETASINTNDANRDQHLRSADFFDVERYPSAEFVSREVIERGDGWAVVGDLTLHGVTREVVLDLEFNGVSSDPFGGTRAGFSATAEINRRDFGVDLSMPLDGGGVVVGDKVKISLEIEAVAK